MGIINHPPLSMSDHKDNVSNSCLATVFTIGLSTVSCTTVAVSVICINIPDIFYNN
ncbi:MAG: hypothetical protein BWY70_00966 [Bacteroidetes bacterium ADurb.Bin408]|nr:MAG: hypothetical protein BWY70_00966 [Bacteroidetes bacterium ADurb.Bin408]